jgi:carboxyl-terminal processing protease
MEINLIAASTADEILRAVKDLQNRGASHFILDLRNNPGGLLTAGVDISRLFLKDGLVIEQQYRGQPVESFKVEKPGPLADLDLAVLINRGSASAAEIIAGSLQAHHRASLIGSPSYGKDTIQLVFDLQDGSSLHVTAAQWWVPGLVSPISGVGLQPDVLVEAGDPNAAGGPDPLIQAAIQELFGVQ